MEYIGKHRIGLGVALLWAVGILMFGFGAWMQFDDAAYHAFVTTGRKHPFDYLPRPVMQGFMAACLIACIAALPLKLAAVLGSRTSFLVKGDGLHSFPLSWHKPRFMPWHEMQSGRAVYHTLVFKGQDRDGKATSILISLVGHDTQTVVAAIAHYRPDIIDAMA